MPFDHSTFERAFIVRWRTSPRPADLELLARLMLEQQRRVGKKLRYLAVVPAVAQVPSADEQRALDRFAENTIHVNEHMYLVLEGIGFRAALQRSVVIGLNWWKREHKTLTVCKSIEEAIERMAKDLGLDRSLLLDHVRAHRLDEADPAA